MVAIHILPISEETPAQTCGCFSIWFKSSYCGYTHDKLEMLLNSEWAFLKSGLKETGAKTEYFRQRVKIGAR